MIRLKYIKLGKLEKLSDGTSTDEINTDAHGELWKDGDTFRIGPDCVPSANVRRWLEMPLQEQGGETCPECSGYFQDKRALGAHRKFKHNVDGARSKDKE